MLIITYSRPVIGSIVPEADRVQYNLEGILKACGEAIDNVAYIEVREDMISIHYRDGGYINHVITMKHKKSRVLPIPVEMRLWGYNNIETRCERGESRSLDMFFSGRAEIQKATVLKMFLSKKRDSEAWV